MKIDRYTSLHRINRPGLAAFAIVKLPIAKISAIGVAAMLAFSPIRSAPGKPPSEIENTPLPAAAETTGAIVERITELETSSQPRARAAKPASDLGQILIDKVLHRLAFGPAFDAKLRKRVWTSDRGVVGVGSYEQAGRGTGHYNLQITMHDGDGKHTLQQISDGRLAWTRTSIAGRVVLKRVEVRVLEQRVDDAGIAVDLAPRFLVGGLTELIESIGADYELNVGKGKLSPGTPDEQSVLVLSGPLKPSVREAVLAASGRDSWPDLCPASVRLLIADKPDVETGFGEGLPRRIEFFSEEKLIAGEDGAQPTRAPKRVISLLEMYSIQPITAPPIERFSLETKDEDNNYVIETQRYLDRYGL